MKKTFIFIIVFLSLIFSKNVTIANTMRYYTEYPIVHKRYIEHYKNVNITFSNATKGTLDYFGAVLGKSLSKSNTFDVKYDRFSRVTHMKTDDKIEYDIEYYQDGSFEMRIDDPNVSTINIIKYNNRDLKTSDTTVEKAKKKKTKKTKK